MSNFAEDVFTDVECIVPVRCEPVEELEVGSQQQRKSMNLVHIASIQNIVSIQEYLNLEFKRLKNKSTSPQLTPSSNFHKVDWIPHNRKSKKICQNTTTKAFKTSEIKRLPNKVYQS